MRLHPQSRLEHTPPGRKNTAAQSQKIYFLYLLIYFSYFLIAAAYEKMFSVYFLIGKRDEKVQKIYFETGAACLLTVREDFFASGLRIYYTVRQNQIVLLLVGGDKSTQSKDIEAASRLIDELEE